MIGADGYFSWAIRDDGPANRILSPLRCPVTVYVCHSMEGVYTGPGGYIVLRDPDTFPTAWHWTKKRDGRVYQHYPIWAHLQHGHAANVLGPGGELEGFQREPITDAQLAADLRIIGDINAWLAAKGAPPLERDDSRWAQGRKRGLVEHREMAPAFNTTQCPSERYARLWAALEDDMADPRVDEILRFLGDAQMKDWLARGNIPFIDAFASEQKARGEATNAINAHIDHHPGGAIGDHTHIPGGVAP